MAYINGKEILFSPTIQDSEGSYKKGFADGKQTEYDKRWDNLQNYGNRKDYDNAFYGSACQWEDGLFAPKYDIKPTSAGNMFQYNRETGLNLKEGLAVNGKKLDFSNCTKMGSCFNYASIGDLPELNLTSLTSIPMMFYQCTAKKIDKIILKNDGSQTFPSTFNGYTSLEEVEFEGLIGQSLSVAPCTKLSKASIESIMGALDRTEGRPATSITLSLAAVNKAFETSEGANDGAESDEFNNVCASPRVTNWTISLV